MSEEAFKQAAWRINNRIDMRCLAGKVEIMSMAQFARRSLGQKVRWIKVSLGN